MRIRRSPDGRGWAPVLGWRLFQLLTVATIAWALWRLRVNPPYRIDIEVYRLGGQAWLDGLPLYADGALFHTGAGLNLPFTYPPLAAVVFSPFALVSLDAAGVAITAITLVLLIVATTIVLTRFDVWPQTTITGESAWLRRAWLAAAIVAPAIIYCEPIRSNFYLGQINVVLMTLVIADCVPRRTPWPRGLLVGLAIALKLTPAIFLLYFLLRRDTRALIVTTVSAVAATLVGFAFAWRDSLEYWTETVRNTDRIGTATFNTNQNIAGTLARLGLDDGVRYVVWILACFAVLGLTIWAVRRVLRAGEPMLALICVATFGLVVSPVSWSHHWVWALPAVLIAAVVGYRRRHAALIAVAVVGVVLMVWTPIPLMAEHKETTASLGRQLVGASYLWWAIALIAVSAMVPARRDSREAADVDAAPVPAVG